MSIVPHGKLHGVLRYLAERSVDHRAGQRDQHNRDDGSTSCQLDTSGAIRRGVRAKRQHDERGDFQ